MGMRQDAGENRDILNPTATRHELRMGDGVIIGCARGARVMGRRGRPGGGRRKDRLLPPLDGSPPQFLDVLRSPHHLSPDDPRCGVHRSGDCPTMDAISREDSRAGSCCSGSGSKLANLANLAKVLNVLNFTGTGKGGIFSSALATRDDPGEALLGRRDGRDDARRWVARHVVPHPGVGMWLTGDRRLHANERERGLVPQGRYH